MTLEPTVDSTTAIADEFAGSKRQARRSKPLLAGTKTTRTALLGLGSRALNDLLPAILQIPEIQIVAAADPCPIARRALQARERLPTFSDPEQLFTRCPVDLAIIAVPHYLHFELAHLALNHQAAVLKEKPYAVTFQQARHLRALETSHRLPVETLLQRRAHYAYRILPELLPMLGRISHVSARYELSVPQPLQGWRGQAELAGGGCILDMGYHMIDLIIWYFGLPDELRATTFCTLRCANCVHPEVEAEIDFRYFTNDIVGTLRLSRVAPLKQETITIVGSQGRIDLLNGTLTLRLNRAHRNREFGTSWSWQVALIESMRHFVRDLGNGCHETSNQLPHLAFIDAAYRSVGSGKKINPKRLWRSIND